MTEHVNWLGASRVLAHPQSCPHRTNEPMASRVEGPAKLAALTTPPEMFKLS